ncbi:hypothetical protein CYY_008125 [Polysphondylium violaceum]|uniref:Coronin n=1 Tax=Polysphondylium violaceum TaxID=133409 RepID=A0A8J4V1L6_9MYCE|nr:hypothetical protein CYY_008125 [Polysphondylium violaceum]
MFKLNVSKYRHTSGKVDKKELWFPDVNVSNSSAASTFVKANPKYVALNWQSNTGTIGLIPLKQFGKRKGDVFVIHAPNTLNDFEFNPFNDFQIAAASDATIRLFSFKEAIASGATSYSDALVTLSGHNKTVKVWDLESGQEKYSIEFDNAILSISWNYDGSLLVATGKDCKVRIIDPRSSTVLQTGEGHQGVKPSRCVWLGNSPYVVTVGFSKMRERQIFLWDSNDLSKVLKTIPLDSSTGIINPIYDQDAQLLFISGTGDSTIRLFDLNTQFTKEPAFQELSPVPSDTPAKGICALPKRALDVMEVEIDRLLKATPNNIIPITFSMARKSKSSFAEDLFPNTNSNKPTLSSNQWLEGETRVPNLMSLNPIDNPIEDQIDELTIREEPKKSTFFNDDNSNEASSSNDNDQQQEEKQQEQEQAKSTVNSGSSTPDNITRTGIVPKIVRTSKYRHIVGTPFQKSQFYTNLKVNPNTNKSIAVNSDYIAIPWIGIGGPLAIIPHAQVGRQITVPCIEIGSALTDFTLSDFDTSVVVTGSEDSHIKVFKVPEGGLPKTGKNYFTHELDLIGHNRKILSVDFHPTAQDVLISTGGDMVVKYWDLAANGAEKLSLNGFHGDAITSVSVNINGDRLLTSSKDKKMRIFDPRSNTLVSETITHSGVKGSKSIWLGQTNNIFSVGFTKQSEREYQLWDSRNLGQPLTSGLLDQLAGVITPYYDEDTSVVYLAGKGDGTIRMFEINDSEPYVHYLTQYTSGSPQVGLAQLNKHSVDVKKCEITRFYKATDNTVEPLQMTVPRNRPEFFQDDIFVPTRTNKPTLSSEEWFDGITREPEFVSICPQGMVNLSEAPPPPKKEEKVFVQEVVDNTPSREQQITGLYNRVMKQHSNNWEELERLRKASEGDDVVSDSEWD